MSTKTQTFQSRYGEWALVTGATSGIGREIARQLAAKGLHIAMVARGKAALETLAQELETQFPVKTLAVTADLTSLDGVLTAIHAMAGRQTGLLVNSAGFGSGGEFLESNIQQEEQMIDVNCRAVLSLSHTFGQRFAAQRRGGIVLLSSIVAFQGVARSANYAATKAYVQSFGEGLREELKPHGVDVLISAPGPTESGFAQRAGMTLRNAVSAEQVARETITALENRRRMVVPGGFAKFLYASLMTAPRFGRIHIMKAVMRSMT